MPLCAVDGCTRSACNKVKPGPCATHKYRLAYSGSPDPGPRAVRRLAGLAELDRALTPEAIQDGPCWEWTGTLSTSGYGVGPRPTQERSRAVHRQAYVLAFGPIAPGLFVCHRCDNPPCYRPSHLFLGTHADNVADMVRKGRQPRTRISRLTDQQVAEIRKLRGEGLKIAVIGPMFGIHPSHVSRICNGVWHAVTDSSLLPTVPDRCRVGHDFTPENTYFRPDGLGRQCRTCNAVRSKRRTARARALTMTGGGA